MATPPVVANFSPLAGRVTLGWMRTIAIALCLAFAAPAAAQDDLPALPSGALDPESYVALSADQRAQMSLGGFRGYLERVREDDVQLYGILDVRLVVLEERETIADIIFWTATGLAAVSLITAIPVHEVLRDGPSLADEALAFIIGGASAFLLGVIIQAIIRPGHDDLMALIDLHDHQLGRR